MAQHQLEILWKEQLSAKKLQTQNKGDRDAAHLGLKARKSPEETLVQVCAQKLKNLESNICKRCEHQKVNK
jgi:hypothetical protein